MQENNIPGVQSTVKTNDLVYVFCAAAWVNVVTNCVTKGIGIWPLVLMLFTFSMIPLELYTSALWQRVAARFDDDPSDDAQQQSVLAMVDMIRVFALTMSFIMLFSPLRILNREDGSLHTICLFSIATGMFLIINNYWNIVLFRGVKASQGANNSDPYYRLFEAYAKSLPSYLSQHDFERDLTLMIVNIFKIVNRVFFRIIFPVFGILLVIVSLFFLIFPNSWEDNYALYLAQSTLAIFGGQFLFKITQIIYVSIILEHVKTPSPMKG